MANECYVVGFAQPNTIIFISCEAYADGNETYLSVSGWWNIHIIVHSTWDSIQTEHPVFPCPSLFCSLHAVQVVLPVRVRRDGGHAGVGLPRRALQLCRLHRLLHHDHGVHLPGKQPVRRSSVSHQLFFQQVTPLGTPDNFVDKPESEARSKLQKWNVDGGTDPTCSSSRTGPGTGRAGSGYRATTISPVPASSTSLAVSFCRCSES